MQFSIHFVCATNCKLTMCSFLINVIRNRLFWFYSSLISLRLSLGSQKKIILVDFLWSTSAKFIMYLSCTPSKFSYLIKSTCSFLNLTSELHLYTVQVHTIFFQKNLTL